jgi:hypothetical protein
MNNVRKPLSAVRGRHVFGTATLPKTAGNFHRRVGGGGNSAAHPALFCKRQTRYNSGYILKKEINRKSEIISISLDALLPGRVRTLSLKGNQKWT